MTDLAKCHNIADLRAAAKRRLPRFIFEFVDRGTEDEHALRESRAAIDRIKLVPRFARNVATRDLSTTLLGGPASMPLAIAPTGAAGLMWYRGEVELARAAAAAKIPFTMATGSMTALDELARQVQGRLWFQLYLWVERELSYDLVRRAGDAGYEALVVTVDTPLSPLREYNDRNGFTVPYVPTARSVRDMLLRPGWLAGTMLRYAMREGMPALQNHPTEFNRRATRAANAPRVAIDASLDFDEITRLRDRWRGKLIVKGILHPQDAVEAVARGADAIIVSTHGGRNFDSAVASFDALPAIAAAVGGKTTIIIDSGIRRGADILKAIALGADAAQVGRATLFGTAVAGQAGAARALELLRRELDYAMANTGCARIADITGDLLA